MATDFLKELEVQRGYLLRVARLQLRDAALAEDVVQDTLTAALVAQSGFTGDPQAQDRRCPQEEAAQMRTLREAMRRYRE